MVQRKIERYYERSETRVVKLQLSKKINGAAFLHPETKNHIYVLWAVTTSDQSEVASEFYTFPYSFHTHSMDIQNWDYSTTKKSTHLASNTIHLSGSPIFIQICNHDTVKMCISCFYIGNAIVNHVFKRYFICTEIINLCKA